MSFEIILWVGRWLICNVIPVNAISHDLQKAWVWNFVHEVYVICGQCLPTLKLKNVFFTMKKLNKSFTYVELHLIPKQCCGAKCKVILLSFIMFGTPRPLFHAQYLSVIFLFTLQITEPYLLTIKSILWFIDIDKLCQGWENCSTYTCSIITSELSVIFYLFKFLIFSRSLFIFNWKML